MHLHLIKMHLHLIQMRLHLIQLLRICICFRCFAFAFTFAFTFAFDSSRHSLAFAFKCASPHLSTSLVCPYPGERAKCSLCGGHAMTKVNVVTLYSRPQILERVDVLERSVADVHLAQQSLSSTPLCSLHSSIGQRAST